MWERNGLAQLRTTKLIENVKWCATINILSHEHTFTSKIVLSLCVTNILLSPEIRCHGKKKL